MTAKAASPLTVKLDRVLKVPQVRAFALLTRPEHLRNWFAPAVGYRTEVTKWDLRPGGEYRIVMQRPDGAEPSVPVGKFVEISPPSRLVMTWNWEDSEPMNSTVTFELAPLDARSCRLTLTQVGFENQQIRDGHEGGWSGSLDLLTKLAAK